MEKLICGKHGKRDACSKIAESLKPEIDELFNPKGHNMDAKHTTEPSQNCEPNKCYPDSPCDYCSRMRDAAPELLEAAKLALRSTTELGADEIEFIQAAIAKAEGRA